MTPRRSGRTEARVGGGSVASALFLPTLSYVLAMTVQFTYMFFLAPGHARVHGLAHLEWSVFAAPAIATVLVSVPAGRLTDLMPRRDVLTLGWAVVGLAPLLLAFLPASPAAFVAASALAGSGFACGHVAFQSYVADVIRGRGLAGGYGVTTALAVLGSAIGPFASAGIVARAASETAGLLHVALALALTAAAASGVPLLLRSRRTADSCPGAAVRVGNRAAVIQAFHPRGLREFATSAGVNGRDGRVLRAYCFAFGLLGLGSGLTHPWLGPRLLDHFALPNTQWALLLGGSTIVGALAVYVAGRLGSRVQGPFPLLLAVNAGVALMLVGFAAAPTALVASGFFVARHFFHNMTNPVIQAGLMNEVGDGARGQSLGTMNLAWNLPWAAGAAAGGPLLAALGAWLFIAGALVIVAGPLVGGVLATRFDAPQGARARAQAPSRAQPTK